MAELFEYAESHYRSGRYGSVHCFSDDIVEVLILAERPRPIGKMVELRNVWPGQFEFETAAGTPYTVTLHSNGATILRPGHGLPKMWVGGTAVETEGVVGEIVARRDQIPYATLSIKRAEHEKGLDRDSYVWVGLGEPVFAALWGRQDSPESPDRHMCIAFELEEDKWEMAVDRHEGLGLWAKRLLCFGKDGP